MRNLQLLLQLQRLLDGDRPDTGLDDLEDLGADDLGDAGGGDLEGLAPILEELDEMSEEPGGSSGEPGADLDGWEDWLEAGVAGDGARARATDGADDLERLETLLRSAEERGPGRTGGGGRARRDARLQRLIRLLDDIEEDDEALKEDVRRLRRLAASRLPAGAAAGRRDLDPVIQRRRGQIREFLAAWRDALRDKRRVERASSPGPRPVRTTARKGDADEG